MIVFQLTLDVYLLEDLEVKSSMEVISKFIDITLCRDEKYMLFHNALGYKNYCFNSLHPTSDDLIYHKNCLYKLQLRTTDMELAQYLSNEFASVKDGFLKVIDVKIDLLPKKKIKKLYSITPCVMKTDKAYWRGHLTEEDFVEALKINLIKKYNAFMNKKIDEDFKLIDIIKFTNRVPIKCLFKGRSLLGDKIDLYIADNDMAQELAYFALGVGLLEINARGFGFVNDKWVK